ncbi:tetratricopeptide repeat protein [Pseudoduganella danionis]|uniref:tetratricopeptide repeat protein n=1 Tax=Pseudoduganella danionis TaxID=1890295 RepID=UPI0035AFDDFD
MSANSHRGSMGGRGPASWRRRGQLGQLLMLLVCLGQVPLHAQDNELGKLNEALTLYQQKQFAAAFKMFAQLARDGFPYAQAMLGNMYLYGEGVAEDDGKALLWLQRAARRSDDMAQNWLGIMYASGRGVPQDLALAAHYYRLAAENGNHAAQTNLAMAYEDGRGVAQDSALARLWYERAVAQGSEAARRYLERLAPAR